MNESDILLSADPLQQLVMEHPARIKVLVAGRRWGKSVLMALDLVKTAIEYPGSHSWYVANDYARCMDQMRMMKQCDDFMELVKHSYGQFPPRFEMYNGSQIAFRSADRPHLLRGAGLKKIAYDEAAANPHGSELFWAILLPMIADTHGTVIVGSTYNGRNWFYDLAEKGKKYGESGNTLVKTWIYPTATGYSFQDDQGKQDLADLKAVAGTMKWKQEYECEPLSVIDAVFPYVEQCIRGELRAKPEDGHSYVVAQDIGRHVDQSGIVVMDVDNGEVVHTESYPLHTPHAQQAERTKQIAQHYNNAVVVLDTTGGAEGGRNENAIRFYATVIENFMPIVFTPDRKRNMITELQLQIERNEISIPADCTELLSQMKLYRYQYPEKAMFPVFFGRPDDLVAAVLMCSWAKFKKFRNTGGLPLSAA